MSVWRTYKLGDLVDQKRGITYGVVQPGKFLKDKGVPILKVNNLTERKFSLKDAFRISEDVESKYERSRLIGNEILISLVGSLGYMYKVPTESIGWNVVRAIGVLPINNEYDKEWIYWFMKSPIIQREFQNQANTTVQATLNLRELRDIVITYPDEDYRKLATSILNSIENKIELNLQMNKTLEGIAQAIFKEWFVDFQFPDFEGELVEGLPKGWCIDSYSKDIKIVYGKNLPTTNLKEKGYAVFGGNGIIGYHDKFLYEKPQIIIACRGAASGKINQTLPKSFVTNNSLVLEIKNDSSINFCFLKYLCSKTDFSGYVTGSAQPQITIENLRVLEFIKPTTKVLKLFEKIIQPVEDKLLLNYFENETLTQLRDTLLPKLMTGKIRVA